MQPESRRNALNTLEDNLPAHSVTNMRPIIHTLDARACLKVIAIVSPSVFREFWLSDASPNFHRLVVELVESARDEKFVKALFTGLSS